MLAIEATVELFVLHVVIYRQQSTNNPFHSTFKPRPIILKFLPIMLLSSAQNVAYCAQYYAHNYCNYAIVHIQFYYFND